MSHLLLETIGLKKTYKIGDQDVPALKGVSLQVGAGEFLAVMGPSGSGKSTFMNLLGCLDTPTEGRYLLKGIEVSSLSADERARIRNNQIGFVFQSFNLLPRTSALDNVALPLRYKGVPMKERRHRAAEMLAKVGTITLRSFPAGNSNVWPLPGPWSATRQLFWRMNPPEPWIHKPALR